MKLGELLDSINVVNHEWLKSGVLVLHIHLWGGGPLGDFEVEQFLLGNDGDGMICAYGEKERKRKGVSGDGADLHGEAGEAACGDDAGKDGG